MITFMNILPPLNFYSLNSFYLYKNINILKYVQYFKNLLFIDGHFSYIPTLGTAGKAAVTIAWP